jgi:deazaflavin-dependent oxidoreductase (nitroreductase family)
LRRVYAAIAALIRRPAVGELVKRAFSDSNLAVYRLSGGRLWNKVRDGDIVLLTTKGSRTGRERVSPLCTVSHGQGWALIGSNVGGPKHPAWVHNLRADPHARLTFGTDEVPVTAHEVTDTAVWDEVFSSFVDVNDGYASYVTKTTRRLPIFLMTADGAATAEGRATQ